MSGFDTDLDVKTADTMKETDKTCPSCGGVMEFDPKTGGLSCPYCGHTQAITVNKQEEKAAEEIDLDKADKLENCDWGAQKKIVICKACGAESVYDALEISAVCPFCGSNQVMEAADQNTMAPGGVVPFQVTDQKASELFRTWIRKKWFCPKLAKESAKAKHFKGVYLPYWTFDANTSSTYQGEFGRDSSHKEKDGREIVETTWYPVRGDYQANFDDELICASSNHNLYMLQQIEPYRTAENKVYKPEYVAGFAAERYSLGVRDAWKLVRDNLKFRISSSIEMDICRKHNADHVRNLRVDTVFRKMTYKYLLLPVWISSYKYKDKIYQFMVNGQTGKVSGKTPISIPKIVICIVGLIIIMALIALLGSM